MNKGSVVIIFSVILNVLFWCTLYLVKELNTIWFTIGLINGIVICIFFLELGLWVEHEGI